MQNRAIIYIIWDISKLVGFQVSPYQKLQRPIKVTVMQTYLSNCILHRQLMGSSLWWAVTEAGSFMCPSLSTKHSTTLRWALFLPHIVHTLLFPSFHTQLSACVSIVLGLPFLITFFSSLSCVYSWYSFVILLTFFHKCVIFFSFFDSSNEVLCQISLSADDILSRIC